ncbi:hypothetical protein O6H91_04G125600 [Diphasiastrum complanatum]|uniref:Uncharacterized protein n=1 Tax=Diphasiastrum complanatum TaxID=34168 RepID=A0ACC2E1S9_DIPCM|nr:hypothetical protein O6H91_04G125600 [Diphasiastrum complanatum]
MWVLRFSALLSPNPPIVLAILKARRLLFCNATSQVCSSIRSRGISSNFISHCSVSGVRRRLPNVNSLYDSLRSNSARSPSDRGYGTSFHERSSEMETVAQSGGLAQRLWEGCRKEACFALYHPFVVALAAGTLKIESFQHYIAQDAFFLTAFAQAFGMAMENAEDEAAKEKLYQLQQSTYEELELHKSYAKAWNVDLAEYAIPHSATKSYVNFLLSIAAGKTETEAPFSVDSNRYSVDVEPFYMHKVLSSSKKSLAAYTLAAMVPCMRLYAFLGQEISNGIKDYSSNPFGKWISTYSSADFKASTLRIEELLNQLAMELKEEDHATMERLFHQAMILEVAFFNAQLSNGACSVPLLKDGSGMSIPFVFMSDFDSTCTISDSCPVLGSLSMTSITSAEKGAAAESLVEAVSDLNVRWATLTTDYIRGYTGLFNQVLLDNEVSGASGRSFEYKIVKLALSKISQYEVEANSRVEDFEVLKNIRLEDVKDAGRKMPLYSGCDHLFQRILDNYEGLDADGHIISVCWSQTFVEGCLSEGVTIHCNELGICEGKSNGKIVKCIQTAIDKQRVFQKIINDKHESLSAASDEEKQFLSIYIGDSITDLLCLLKADVGIVIGQNESLRRFALAFGIILLPLYEGLLQKEPTSQSKYKGRSGEGVIYTVSDWHEIEAFLLGFHQQACKSKKLDATGPGICS